MSKIVQAVNAMISNPDKITKVLKGNDEYFFLYRDKYKWSIRGDNENGHVLFYYPGSETLEELAATGGSEWGAVDMVVYKDADIGTKEAKATFAELLSLIRERVFGVNLVLDDIIGDAEK